MKRIELGSKYGLVYQVLIAAERNVDEVMWMRYRHYCVMAIWVPLSDRFRAIIVESELNA